VSEEKQIMVQGQRRIFVGAGVITALSIIVGVVVLMAAGPKNKLIARSAEASSQDNSAAGDEPAISVKTIRPKRDPAFVLTHDEPAYVEAYRKAPLEAQAAGPVTFVQKDIGDHVTGGERLVEVAVPDLVQEIEQKKAAVTRARMDLRVAERQVRIAELAIEVANDNIEIKAAERKQAEATMQLRGLELQRIQIMVSKNAVYEDVKDERQRDYQAAMAACEGATVAVKKARADLDTAKAKLEATRADVDLKQSLVDVALQDQKRAEVLRDFAIVRAPFNGIITDRKVDLGSFVQNSTTSRTEPLLTVERQDIVTVYMELPDKYAPYVKRGTEVTIELSELPAQLIHAKVTRDSSSINLGGRRMRVEVDLYNGRPEDFDKFKAEEEHRAIPYDDLKDGKLPFLPKFTGSVDPERPHKLLPGMLGRMWILLRERELRNAYLVPSSVVFSQGGKPYIYEVVAGKANLVPVDVPVDDGKLAKVVKIVHVGNEEVKQELTDKDEVIASNQGELTDGQPVKTTPVD
jgi:multidrug resistance efflux pump